MKTFNKIRDCILDALEILKDIVSVSVSIIGYLLFYVVVMTLVVLAGMWLISSGLQTATTVVALLVFVCVIAHGLISYDRRVEDYSKAPLLGTPDPRKDYPREYTLYRSEDGGKTYWFTRAEDDLEDLKASVEHLESKGHLWLVENRLGDLSPSMNFQKDLPKGTTPSCCVAGGEG